MSPRVAAVTRRLAAAGALAAAVACSDPAPGKKPSPRPLPPTDLIAVASLPDLAGGMDGLIAFLTQVSPELGERAQAGFDETLQKTPFVDESRPAWTVLTMAPGESMATAYVTGTRADAAFPRQRVPNLRSWDRWVTVGRESELDRLAPWMMQTLPLQPVPPRLAMTIYPPAILASRRAELTVARTRFLAGVGGQPSTDRARLGEAMFDGLIEAARSIERIEVEVDADGSRATIEARIIPRPRTRLATWISEGQPSTFEMVPRLTTAGAMLVFAGRDLIGPARVLKSMFADETSADPEAPLRGDIQSLAAELEARITREMALALTFRQPADAADHGIDVDLLFGQRGASDPRSAAVELPLHERVGIVYWPGAVGIRFAWWDDLLGVSLGGDNRARLERMIGISHGSRPPDVIPPGFAAAIEDARARHASQLLIVDLVAIFTRTPGEDGVSVTLGFDRGALVIRASSSARHLAAVRTVAPMALVHDAFDP